MSRPVSLRPSVPAALRALLGLFRRRRLVGAGPGRRPDGGGAAGVREPRRPRPPMSPEVAALELDRR